ncbi:MAG TPA: carboxypeptidase-like regulatory domain-containing protein, partial [Candidatus Nitrosotenuis sp.]|nr:carboxypeptidase-like regulatory domain-containing protein [Candidatus Nitrosotenuis sp.]
MNPTYLIVLVAMLSLVGIANAELDEKLTISVSLKTNDNHPPIISGYIKDESGQPVGNAAVQISSSLETTQVNSDEDGFFVYNLPATPSENKFSVSVKAQKEGYQSGYANTSFYVNGVEQPIDNTSQETGASYADSNNLKNDPIAQKILQQIEMNKQKEAERQKKLAEIAAREKFLEEQRQLANQNLLNDLGGWFVQFDPFNPRNAFASFASQFDEGLQSI